MLDESLKAALLELSSTELEKLTSFISGELEERTNPDSDHAGAGAGDLIRRRHRRHECFFRATFIRHCLPEDKDSPNSCILDAVVKDISQGGIKMHIATALEIDEVLTVFLKSEVRVEKRVFVKVVRCVDHWDHFEIGSMFVEQQDVLAAQRHHLTRQTPSSSSTDSAE